jgi:uncharacterized membrane protein YfcA
LAAAAFAAGIQNALAGGGSFLTFPALLMTGLDPQSANITSTIALFPAQVSTGITGRREATGTPSLSFTALFVISLIGGALGALLLLKTPSDIFTAWSRGWCCSPPSYSPGEASSGRSTTPKALGSLLRAPLQFCISIYGGYFGGGIGILMLAVLTLSGLKLKNAGATKNVLAGVMNSSAVLIFIFLHDVAWKQALVAVAATAADSWEPTPCLASTSAPCVFASCCWALP